MGKPMMVVLLFGSMSASALAEGHVSACESQKQALLAKKEACHGLPKEQRAACKAERQQLKAALESCKAEAKAKKAAEPKKAKN
jgi:hypothetical protein